MNSNKIPKPQAVHVQRIDLTKPLELVPSTSSKGSAEKPDEGEPIEIRHESTESSESEKRNDEVQQGIKVNPNLRGEPKVITCSVE